MGYMAFTGSRKAGIWGIPALSKASCVAEDVALFLWLEVGEDEVFAVNLFARESTFFEHVGGGVVLGVADGFEALDARLPRYVDHGL